MADPAVKEKEKKPKEPSLAETSQRLAQNVEAYLQFKASQFPDLKDKAMLTTDHVFDKKSPLQQGLRAISEKLTALANSNPTLKSVADELKAEVNNGLKTNIQAHFTELTSVAKNAKGDFEIKPFSKTSWDKSFKNIEDLINTHTKNPNAGFPNNPDLKAIADDIATLKNTTINTEVARLSRSVESMRTVQYSDAVCQAQYGGDNYARGQFRRIDLPAKNPDNPMNAEDNPDVSLKSQPKEGLGQNGFYRQPRSDYIVQLKDGVYTASYSPMKKTIGEKIDSAKDRFSRWYDPHRYDEKDKPFLTGKAYNFRDKYASIVEAMSQMSHVEIIVFDYGDPREFSKYHLQNIEIALGHAEDMLNAFDKGQLSAGMGMGLKSMGFELGPGAMEGLLTCEKISDKQRQSVLDRLEAVKQRHENNIKNQQQQQQQYQDQQAQQKSAAATPATTHGTSTLASAAEPTSVLSASNNTPAATVAATSATADNDGAEKSQREQTNDPVINPDDVVIEIENDAGAHQRANVTRSPSVTRLNEQGDNDNALPANAQPRAHVTRSPSVTRIDEEVNTDNVLSNDENRSAHTVTREQEPESNVEASQTNLSPDQDPPSYFQTPTRENEIDDPQVALDSLSLSVSMLRTEITFNDRNLADLSPDDLRTAELQSTQSEKIEGFENDLKRITSDFVRLRSLGRDSTFTDTINTIGQSLVTAELDIKKMKTELLRYNDDNSHAPRPNN